ncbi:hypothetical protein FB451DRAFT_1385004 [Mycena latifolia]|nr:hypothetical protein FB451DRAFT_1385004 [Mycena latifolia]
MRLFVSTNKPINAIYTEAESRIVQYKVRTPIRVPELNSKISRRLESDIPRRRDSQDDAETNTDEARFGLLANISWRMGGESVIRFGGREIDPVTFFRRENLGWYGKEYIYMAQDGKEYRWCIRPYTTRLKTNDASATAVVRTDGFGGIRAD